MSKKEEAKHSLVVTLGALQTSPDASRHHSGMNLQRSLGLSEMCHPVVRDSSACEDLEWMKRFATPACLSLNLKNQRQEVGLLHSAFLFSIRFRTSVFTCNKYICIICL